MKNIKTIKIVNVLLAIGFIIAILFATKNSIIKSVFQIGAFDTKLNEPEVVAIDEIVYFPKLRGKYNVGRTKIHIDDYSRYEIFSSIDESQIHRQVLASVYYPTNDIHTKDAIYVSEEYAVASAKYLIEYPMRYLVPNCIDEGKVAYTDDGFPVLLFSPGGALQVEYYSYIFEELASHGYIVIAIPEIYSTPVVEFADGQIREIVEIRCANNFMLEAFTNNKAVGEVVDYYFCYNSTFDMLTVLNGLFSINDSHALLAGSMDLESIGAFGHSIGGATAANAALHTNLIDSVIVYDSYIFHIVDENARPLSVPSLFIGVDGIDYQEYELQEVNANNQKVIEYLNKSNQNEFIMLDGASHMSFLTDILIGLNSYEKAYDELLVKGVTVDEMLDNIVLPTIAFFDSTLLGY